MLYTTSELLELIKEDMGLRDLPRVITDEKMIKRMYNSALKEFSIRCPYIVESYVNDNEKINSMDTMYGKKYIYKIPKTYYMDSKILYVTRVDPIGCDTHADFFDISLAPDILLGTIADYKLYSTLQQSIYPALTFHFTKPDKVEIYNGWGGTYMVELALVHDISLATIPDTAMSSFRELALLDMEEYFYNTLKRIDNINTGAGEFQLKIDEWANAKDQKRDLLKSWDEDASLDVDSIKIF